MLKQLFLTIIIFNCAISNAEVIADGTLGQQHGGNLFHSFQDFNLNSSESAIFSGPKFSTKYNQSSKEEFLAIIVLLFQILFLQW